MRTALKYTDVHKTYNGVYAVRGMSFSAEESTSIALLGPNGAGKSTLMNMAIGRVLRDPSGGAIEILGSDPADESLRIKYLSGVVPQDDNLDEELNVFQNLYVYSRFYGVKKAKALLRIEELLDFMQLSVKIDARIKELSGGMRRRLLIARALINRPSLLILDEPTTGLDPQARHMIWDRLNKLKKNGTSILLSTHYMEEAYRIADKVVIMHLGKKLLEGDPVSLLSEHIEAHVIEIKEKSDFSGSVRDAAERFKARVDLTHDTVMVYTDDKSVMRAITEDLSDGAYISRERNLEDLFIKLTGRDLD